jgi:hypothetical protein
MKGPFKTATRTAIVAMLFVGSGALCKAQVTVETKTSASGSNYRYEYTVTNIGSTPVSAVNIQTGSAVVDVTAPSGWLVQQLETSHRRLVQWVAVDSSADIAPGSVVSGFAVTSSSTPGTVDFGVIDEVPTIFDEAQAEGPAYLPSQAANISTRAVVGEGDKVLIGGFIITGTQNKTVILRAIGPSLPVSGALTDPIIELYDSAGMLISTNDSWRDARDSEEIVSSGIPPSDDKESALLADLQPGAYTAVVRGVTGLTGIGLVEVYDFDLKADSQLANISTRGLVQTGDNVLIGGFIIVGTGGPSKVLARAVGPSLTQFGVSGALQDPTLELHDGSGTTIANNDNWKTRPDGSSQQAEIEATTIPPTNDLESALAATLAPGNYTVIVRGTNDTAGVALVEVYNLK